MTRSRNQAVVLEDIIQGVSGHSLDAGRLMEISFLSAHIIVSFAG